MPAGIEKHRNRYRVRKWVNGTRIRRSFPTLEEAQRYLEELNQGLEDQRERATRRGIYGLTVGDVVEEWWLGPLVDGQRRGGHRRRVAARTARDYQGYIDRYVSRIAERPLREYDENPALLKLFYDSLPNRMAWHVHGVLRLAFKEAVAKRHLERNPCEIEKPARRKRTKRIIPDRDEKEMIIAAAEDEDALWGLFVYLTSTLGTRCAETCALRTEDFDPDAGIVHIERAVSKTAGGPTLKEPKKGEPRDLPIDDPDFWAYVEPVLGAPGFLFPGFYRDEQHKGPDARPKPWHPDHAQARFRKMTRRLGLPQYTLHSLRHHVATQLLIEGQPINQVAEFLGHTPQMTLMLYGRHLDREAMRRVGRTAASLTKRTRPRPPEPQPATKTGYRWALDLILDMAELDDVTNAGVRAKTGLTRRQAYLALDQLARSGRLVRLGAGRTTRYQSRARSGIRPRT